VQKSYIVWEDDGEIRYRELYEINGPTGSPFNDKESEPRESVDLISQIMEKYAKNENNLD
jgi:hypothetical protein